MTTSVCGEYRGYQQHRARGEEPCVACDLANKAYHRKYRRDASRRRAATSKAYYAALHQVAENHRDEFTALYAAENKARGVL